MRFWPLAGALALVLGGAVYFFTRSTALTAMAALSWGPSLAFFVCAIWSAVRR